MQSRGNKYDTAPSRGVTSSVRVLGGGFKKIWERGFEGVEGADHVDVDNGFEGVCGEASQRGEEVACCAGAGIVSNPSSIRISKE